MPGTEPVPMTEAERLARNFDQGRLLEDADPHILKIVVAPDIVITLEEIHFHPGIHQIHKGGENPHIAFGHDIVVLIPEIPDIPEHIQRLCPLQRNRIQKGHETSLPVHRVLYIQTQMNI